MPRIPQRGKAVGRKWVERRKKRLPGRPRRAAPRISLLLAVRLSTSKAMAAGCSFFLFSPEGPQAQLFKDSKHMKKPSVDEGQLRQQKGGRKQDHMFCTKCMGATPLGVLKW